MLLLLQKSYVRAHKRRLGNGRVILVGSYHNKVAARPKHGPAKGDERTGDLFEGEPQGKPPGSSRLLTDDEVRARADTAPAWPSESEARKAGFEDVDEVKKLAAHRDAIADAMAKEHMRRERHADKAWKHGKYTRAKFRIHHIAEKYGMNPHSHVLDSIAGHVALGTMGAGPDEERAARAVAFKTVNQLLARAGLNPARLPATQPEEPDDSLFTSR